MGSSKYFTILSEMFLRILYYVTKEDMSFLIEYGSYRYKLLMYHVHKIIRFDKDLLRLFGRVIKFQISF